MGRADHHQIHLLALGLLAAAGSGARPDVTDIYPAAVVEGLGVGDEPGANTLELAMVLTLVPVLWPDHGGCVS